MLPKLYTTGALEGVTQLKSAQVVALPGAEAVKRLAHAPRFSPIALALVIIAHFGIFAALISLHITSMPMLTSAVIVEVIRTDSDAQKMPDATPLNPVTPPKPKLVSHQTHHKLVPVLATERPIPTPTAEVAKIIQPVALPLIQASAKPAVSNHAVQTAPRFDANYLDNPAPVYPPLSRHAGEEGKVVLRVFVEPSGLPSRVEVRASSGFERLDKSAATAVSRWKFIPARLGHAAVGAWVLVPVNFILKA